MSTRYSLLVLFAFACPATSGGAVIMLKDGRTLEGKVVEVSGVAEDPTRPKIPAGEIAVTPILLLDDGLHRVYIHKSQVHQILEQTNRKKIRIRLWQNVAKKGAPIAHVGRSMRVDPFDEYGRRIYELVSRDGPLPVVQGITEITPVYTRVQGLRVDPRSYVWDMRIATSSIPRETLNTILVRAVPQQDLDNRLQVVRLYLQGKRYRDARLELEKIITDFPGLEDRQQEIRQLRQMGARSILEELKLRTRAGQHQLVRTMLDQFSTEEVDGETLQQVRELVKQHESNEARQAALLTQLNDLAGQISDPIHAELTAKFLQEISAGLNSDTVSRFNSFARLVDGSTLTPGQKVALALSGWLVGSNNATDNFAVALSLTEVRDLVLEYLRSDQPVHRTEVLAELRDVEGATVERITDLLKRLAPPKELSDGAHQGYGYYELAAPGMTGAADVKYAVQVPLEYHPLRNYPAIVMLNGQGYSSQQELDFWAGAPRENASRAGQAMRHGYVAIAVQWQEEHQLKYQYSAREHHAVLTALRDALRHFSIDTDRVFLSGHGIGGDAAWDIALAHPDLWAGVVPILAAADRYCSRYWMNAEFTSWYFVVGEKDGNKMARNAREFDRYLRPKFDATIVEFQGRGYEAFHDEIQNLFDWMNRRKRRAIPKEFRCATMRPWDNYFWWLEVEGLPPKTMVEPAAWPPPRGARPAQLRGKVGENNKLSVFGQAQRTTVWLSPEMVDFDRHLRVEVNGRRITGRERFVKPEVAVLLEDVRTRGDRNHPFWAKVDSGQK